MRGGESAYSGHTRANDGVIVTLVDLASGRTESRHLGGVMGQRHQLNYKRSPQRIEVGILDLLRSLAEELDERSGEWRIRSISSPSTILADLRRREANATVAFPEAIMLAKVGREDLLERPLRFHRPERRRQR